MNNVAKATQVIKGAVKEASIIEARKETDTIRLWENYKDQALLWRSLALLQIPTTLLAVIFSLVLWHSRKITLQVPRQPLPGIYSATEIPNEKFIEAATDVVNLISSYTPANARSQFQKARELLKEPLLSTFDTEMRVTEIKQIESTSRSQVFFVDPSKTLIQRSPSGNQVLVQLEGERLKIVGGRELPAIPTVFRVTMTTVPRNMLNPYGILATEIKVLGVDPHTAKPKEQEK
jgi:hypothetical protein